MKMSGIGGEQETLMDLADKCSVLMQEMEEVLAELDCDPALKCSSSPAL